MSVNLKVFDISDPILKLDIKFAFGGDSASFLKAVEDYDGKVAEDHGEFTTGIVFANRPDPAKSPTFWIWVQKFNGSVEAYSFVGHELIHFLQEVLEWKEFPLSGDTSESCAAYYEYILEQILTILRGLRRRKK